MKQERAAIVIAELGEAMPEMVRQLVHGIAYYVALPALVKSTRDHHVDTGQLFRDWRVAEDGKRVSVRNTRPQAEILNSGGVIRPKKGRALAIPLGDRNKHRVPREFDDLFVWKDVANSKVYLASKVNKGRANERLRPEFLLVPSVTIKGSGYIDEGVKQTETEAPAFIEERLGSSIADKVRTSGE